MTREDIIRLAREAEDYADTICAESEYYPGWLEVFNFRFAALVAAAEREAEREAICELADNLLRTSDAVTLIDAIRARGCQK
jgi:hypothetical protein